MGHLRLITGGAKTGKSRLIYNEISTYRDRETVLIVPEQYSHSVTRQLCAACGDSVALYAQVLSFTDLARRIFEQYGGAAMEFLDDSGRLLLMNRCLEKLKETLRVYSGVSAKPGVLSRLLETVDEFKTCGISADQLGELCESVDFGEKLTELAAIFETYNALSEQTGLSPADRLTIAAEKMRAGTYASGITVYIDGFSDFTHQEMEIISMLIERCQTVTVALTVLRDTNHQVFSVPLETVGRLMAAAKKVGAAVETINLFAEEKGELAFLSENIFSSGSVQYSAKTEKISLRRCVGKYDECLWAAGEVARLVEKGARYRDITVAVRSVGDYRHLLESAFELYDIPLFVSGSSDLGENPIYTLITGALDTVTGGFEYEDIFRYLKTGLANISWDDCDVLENYVLKWNISGSMWWREEDWKFNPMGYGLEFDEESSALLNRVNCLRRQVREPLVRLRKAQMERAEAVSRLEALYDFLVEINLPENLMARAERLEQDSQLRKAGDYEKMWPSVVAALDQCAAILGDTPLERGEFAELFSSVIACQCVDTIPVSIDRVQLTEISRTGHSAPSHLFLLGANDSYIPMATENAGVITEQERLSLLDLGLSLQPGEQTLLERELYSLYSAVSAPGNGLHISWSTVSDSGEELRPSFFIKRITELFPQLEIVQYRACEDAMCLSLAMQTGAEQLGETGQSAVLDALRKRPELGEKITRVEQAAAYQRGALTPEAVSKLYGGRFDMSASRIDKFNSCHFAYFMQYGLKARPRKKAGFDAPEMGTFVHEILENTARDVEELGGFKSVESAEVREIAKKHVSNYIEHTLDGFRDKTPRFKYLFNRLLKNVYAVVEDMAAELKVSDFRPMEFELEFGGKGDLPPVVKISPDGEMRISGFVDRVDGWVKDGKLYLRVVDYKTGRKKFDLTDIASGLGLQMLIYLFALKDNGAKKFGTNIEPAGVLYVPARDITVKGGRNMTEQERLKQVAKELKRSGVILDDEDVISAMENSGDGSIHFLPVTMRNGKITGESLVSAQRLGRLAKHIDGILQNMIKELAAGSVAAAPFVKAQQSPCDYCEFKAACLFDPDGGRDAAREIKPVKSNEFWLELEKREEADNG